MQTLKLKFVRERETPNTVRFKEVREGGWKVGEKPTVGTLYVAKLVAGDVDAVTVTIEPTDEGPRNRVARPGPIPGDDRLE